MRVYKGFNKKIQAKHGKGTFQYEKGKTYKEEKSKTRSTGFHAAEYILDCLQWYPIDGKNKFFLCEADGSIDEENGCSMVVSTELTLIRELTLMEIAMAAMEYMIIHPKREWEKRERGAYAEKERSKAIGETKIAIARGKHPESVEIVEKPVDNSEQMEENERNTEAGANSEPVDKSEEEQNPAGSRWEYMKTMESYKMALYMAASVKEMPHMMLNSAEYWKKWLEEEVDENGEELSK